MQNSQFKFTNDQIDLVVNALYVSREDDELRDVFIMMDKVLGGTEEPLGYLTADKFKLVMPLLGEDLDEDKVSRHIEFSLKSVTSLLLLFRRSTISFGRLIKTAVGLLSLMRWD